MKKISMLLILTSLLFVGTTGFSQTPDEKITVSTSDLTTDQLAKIKAEAYAKELEKKVETYGKWVGVGGEVGTAVREGLTAVVDVSDKFGKTDVGKFTMIMIAWKVMGRDILRIIFGLIAMTVFTWFLIYSFRTTCIERKVLIKNPGFLKYPKEYKIIEPRFGQGDGLGGIRFLHILMFVGGLAITYSIMFG